MKLATLSLLALKATSELRNASAEHPWWSGDLEAPLTWNYHLNAESGRPENVTPDVDVYMIDMGDGPVDDNDVEDRSVVLETISALHEASKKVVCYISIGTWEDWRVDAEDFPREALGCRLGWPGEKWIDFTYVEDGGAEPVVYEIMRARIRKAIDLGCDGIEPDNMSAAYESDTGFMATKQQQIDYVRWFVDEVKSQAPGMLVGMKNLAWDDETTDDLAMLAQSFDFGINESCYHYSECGLPRSWFIEQGKPVFHVEYRENYHNRRSGRRALGAMCDDIGTEDSSLYGFSTIVKTYDLYGPYCSCGDGDIWRCGRDL